jgi:hypothetical protein
MFRLTRHITMDIKNIKILTLLCFVVFLLLYIPKILCFILKLFSNRVLTGFVWWTSCSSSFHFTVLCFLVCLSSFCVLCPMIPVSAECSFLIAISIYSSVYLVFYLLLCVFDCQCIINTKCKGLCCLTPLSTIFQIYLGGS